MNIVANIPIKDQKEKLIDGIGDISGVQIFNNQVLCIVYVREEKTKGGIYMPASTREEDKYQSKIGLVVSTGPSAFNDPKGDWFSGVDIGVKSWVIFRPSDGWSITINGVLCRIISDTNILGTVDRPERVY